MLKLWYHKTGDTFGTTVNSANIISLLLTLFLILKVESGAFVSLLHAFYLTLPALLSEKAMKGESEGICNKLRELLLKSINGKGSKK